MNLRRSVARFLVPPLIAGVLTVHVEGCAGLAPEPPGIGNPRGDDGPIVQRIGVGAEIEITRRDGVLLRGTFHGTIGMSAEEYAQHREIVLQSLGAGDARAQPAPGDSIEIRPLGGPAYLATFASFEAQGLETRRDGLWTTIPFGRIREVRTGRWTRDRSQLLDDAIAGRLPMSTSILLGVADGDVRVPVDQVARVGQSSRGGNGGSEVALGILIGATAVVLLVVAAAHSAEHSSCGSIDLPPGTFTGGFTDEVEPAPHLPVSTASES